MSGWGKFHEDVVRSALVDQVDPEAGGVPVAMCVYGLLVALADQHGCVRVASAETLARTLNFPQVILERALQVLEDPQIAPEYSVSRIDSTGGERGGWKVESYGTPPSARSRENAQNACASTRERARVDALYRDPDIDIDPDVNRPERDPRGAPRAADEPRFEIYRREIWRTWRDRSGKKGGFTDPQKQIVRRWFEGCVPVGFAQGVIRDDPWDRVFSEYENRVLERWEGQNSVQLTLEGATTGAEAYADGISKSFKRFIDRSWSLDAKDLRMSVRLAEEGIPLWLILKTIDDHQESKRDGERGRTLRYFARPITAAWKRQLELNPFQGKDCGEARKKESDAWEQECDAAESGELDRAHAAEEAALDAMPWNSNEDDAEDDANLLQFKEPEAATARAPPRRRRRGGEKPMPQSTPKHLDLAATLPERREDE